MITTAWHLGTSEQPPHHSSVESLSYDMNVVVVGAGIIGASISRQLSAKGAKVGVGQRQM